MNQLETYVTEPGGEDYYAELKRVGGRATPEHGATACNDQTTLYKHC